MKPLSINSTQNLLVRLVRAAESVTIELFVAPEDSDIYLRMEQVMVGEWGPGALTESICGPTDDRIPSNDPAVGNDDTAQARLIIGSEEAGAVDLTNATGHAPGQTA